MKLEAVDPAAPISIRPATVTKATGFPIKYVSPHAAMLISRFAAASWLFMTSLPLLTSQSIF